MKKASLTKNSDLFFCIRGTIGPSCGIVVEWKLKIYEQNPLYTFSQINAIGTTPTFYPLFDELTIVNASVSDENEDYFGITAHNKFVGQPALVSGTSFEFYDGDVITREAAFSQNVIAQIPNIGGILIGYESFSGSYVYIRCVRDAFGAGGLIDNKNVSDCNDQEYLRTYTESTVGLQGPGWLYDTKEEYDEFVTGGLGYQLMINDIVNNCPSSAIFCAYYTSTWGGAMNDPAPDSTAFPWRETKFDMNQIIFFNVLDPSTVDSNFVDASNWARNTFLTNSYSNGFTTRRGYCNYIIVDFVDEEDYLPYYYGDNIDKLIDSKCKYDPMNIFTNPQGIPVDDC